MLNQWKSILAITVLLFFSAMSFAEIAIIVNPQASALNKSEVKKVFMGKMKTFPSGNKIVVFDQVQGSDIRTDFYKKVIHKSTSQMKAYWASIIFSGKGKPPRALKGDMIVRGMVANNKNAIGYIDAVAIDESVKVLAIIP